MKVSHAVFFGAVALSTAAILVGSQIAIQRYLAREEIISSTGIVFPLHDDVEFFDFDFDVETGAPVGAFRIAPAVGTSADAHRDVTEREGFTSIEELFKQPLISPGGPALVGGNRIAAHEAERARNANSDAGDHNSQNSPAERRKLSVPSILDAAWQTLISKSKSTSPPERIAAPENAAPIDTERSREDAQTRTIIEQELPSAGRDEQDVWFEELRGMSPRMMRELLRLRRKFGTERPTEISRLPGLPPSQSEANATKVFEVSPAPAPAPAPALALDIVMSDRFIDGTTSHYGRDRQVDTILQSATAAIELAWNVALNNIANVNTIGFKRSRVLFEDLPYQQVKRSGQLDLNGQLATVGIAVGLGVQVGGTLIDHSQGALRQTGRMLDVAIAGDGYFQVQERGEIYYTRSGRFTLNGDGALVLTSADQSRPVEPMFSIPLGATAIQVSADGIVSVQLAAGRPLEQLGSIQTAWFANPAGLEPRGENLFAATEAAGLPAIGNPNMQGRGPLRQGFLEESNAKLPEELNELRRLQAQEQALHQAATLLAPTPSARMAAGAREGR